MSRRLGIVLVVASLAIALAGCGGDDSTRSGGCPRSILVAAASDLRPAFEELGRMFEAKTGTKVTFTSGSSGQLAQQIKQGAPFDLFAAANVSLVDDVLSAGKGDPATMASYAFGRIVIWTKDGTAKSVEDLKGSKIVKLANRQPRPRPLRPGRPAGAGVGRRLPGGEAQAGPGGEHLGHLPAGDLGQRRRRHRRALAGEGPAGQRGVGTGPREPPQAAGAGPGRGPRGAGQPSHRAAPDGARLLPAGQLDVAVRHRIGNFDLDVAFRVERGLAVLFGPSGAGKSLTLNIVAGLARPRSGRVEIAGRVVTDASPRLHVRTQDRRIGMVFQEGRLFPHRSVLDNVALAVRGGKNRAERRDRAAAWLERVGAADFAARRPGELSGGQRQRVALARALAGDPALLLLDEPLSALDLTVRRQLRGVIRQVVTEAGVPSVLVTHDKEEADELADLVIAYDHGRVTGTRQREQPESATIDLEDDASCHRHQTGSPQGWPGDPGPAASVLVHREKSGASSSEPAMPNPGSPRVSPA